MTPLAPLSLRPSPREGRRSYLVVRKDVVRHHAPLDPDEHAIIRAVIVVASRGRL
jgi:hypothetical protein